MKKLLLLCCFVTICSSLKAMDPIPLKQIIDEKNWVTLINRIINHTVTSTELYAYDKSNFEGNTANGWSLLIILVYNIGNHIDIHDSGEFTRTQSSETYCNILEQLIALDKISIPNNLIDLINLTNLDKSRAGASAHLCNVTVTRVKKHLDHINIALRSQSWSDLATYMNLNSLHAGYVMHLSPDQNQKLITALNALAKNLSASGQEGYVNKICTELSQKVTIGSHVPQKENKTFFNAVTPKYIGLASLCIIIGIATYKYYHASPENEDEKEQEQVTAA